MVCTACCAHWRLDCAGAAALISNLQLAALPFLVFSRSAATPPPPPGHPHCPHLSPSCPLGPPHTVRLRLCGAFRGTARAEAGLVVWPCLDGPVRPGGGQRYLPVGCGLALTRRGQLVRVVHGNDAPRAAGSGGRARRALLTSSASRLSSSPRFVVASVSRWPVTFDTLVGVVLRSDCRIFAVYQSYCPLHCATAVRGCGAVALGSYPFCHCRCDGVLHTLLLAVQWTSLATMASVSLSRAAMRQGRELAANAASAAVGPTLQQRGVNRVTATWASAGTHSGALRRVPAAPTSSSADSPLSFAAAAAPRVIPWPASPGMDVIKMACEARAAGHAAAAAPAASAPGLASRPPLAPGASLPVQWSRARSQLAAASLGHGNDVRVPSAAAASASQAAAAVAIPRSHRSGGVVSIRAPTAPPTVDERADSHTPLASRSYSARAEVVFQSVWSRMEAEGCVMSFPTEVVWLNGAPGSGKVRCCGCLGARICWVVVSTVFVFLRSLSLSVDAPD